MVDFGTNKDNAAIANTIKAIYFPKNPLTFSKIFKITLPIIF